MRVTAFSARNKNEAEQPDVAAPLYTVKEGVVVQRVRDAVPCLLKWYRAEARPLPWRSPLTPYRVWVSEIMLQQTRVEAVIPYFERFMAELPTVEALAAVSDERLMKLWEGLGYYSRARNLKKAAVQICERHGGELPADFEALRALPGLGDYTAGAVASIAFGIAVPAVDGNVLRVVSRLTADFDDVMQTATRRRHTETVRTWLPPDAAGDFNAALMELGERVCLPNTVPRCEVCPLAAACEGYRREVAVLLPTRRAKTARRVEQRTVMVFITDEETPRVLLHKRPPKGLLAGLWELPHRETDDVSAAVALAAKEYGADVRHTRTLGEGVHLFSHIEWRMQGVAIQTAPFTPPDEYVWATLEEVHTQYALPTAFRTFSRLLPVLLERNETE